MSRCEIRCLTYVTASLSSVFESAKPRHRVSRAGSCPSKVRLFWVPGPYCKRYSGPYMQIKLLLSTTSSRRSKPPSLDHDLLLLGIDSAALVLRGNGDQGFAIRQRW